MNDREREELFTVMHRRKPFDRMSGEHLRWLVEQMQLVRFPAGTAVLKPGIPCDTLYFIRQGLIQLEAMGTADEEKKVLAELVEGESFPLEALEEHRPVFSTFRAKLDTVCYQLSAKGFEELKAKSRVFAEFCRYRAASFLEQSRRVYRLHFSHQSEEQQRLNIPLSLLMRPDPLSAGPWEPVRDVLVQMHARDADAAVIVGGDDRPEGLFTMRDLLRNVVVPGEGLDLPVGKAMSTSPATLPVTALGYEAALAMAEAGSHHIVLVDDGKLAGIVSEGDIFNLQRVSLSQINAEIRTADSIDWLKRCARDIRMLAENMVVQGVTAEQITQIISTLNDQVICRALDIVLAGADLSGIRIDWISLGSEGRYEQTFSTDQDNGIIFESRDGADPEAVRARLLPLAVRFNRALDDIGFPLCKGNVMAGNPACCLSYEEWQKKFAKWIDAPTPDALLNATIFFDFRHLYGDATLSDRLRIWLATAAMDRKRFLHLMTENALQKSPPIGFFRDFVVEDDAEHPDTIDVKMHGVGLFVDAARVYALATGVTRGNTRQRLIAVGDILKWPQSEVNAWADAFSFLQSLRIRHQFELRRSGTDSHNRLNPYELNNLDRKFFLESLRQAGRLQKQLEADHSVSGGR